MTKFQKIGLTVVAFCATVAITRRIQQEYDKDAVLRSANETQALIDCLWDYDGQLSDGTYGFRCIRGRGLNASWSAELIRTEGTPALRPTTEANYSTNFVYANDGVFQSGRFNPSSGELEIKKIGQNFQQVKMYFRLTRLVKTF